jgi:hypothetical protein
MFPLRARSLAWKDAFSNASASNASAKRGGLIGGAGNPIIDLKGKR